MTTRSDFINRTGEFSVFGAPLQELAEASSDRLGPTMNGFRRMHLGLDLRPEEKTAVNNSRVAELVNKVFSRNTTIGKSTGNDGAAYALATLQKAYGLEQMNSVRLMGSSKALINMNIAAQSNDPEKIGFIVSQCVNAIRGQEVASDSFLDPITSSIKIKHGIESDSEKKAYDMYIIASLNQRRAELNILADLDRLNA